MPRNSKDNSLGRYRQMEEMSKRYLDSLSAPRLRITMNPLVKHKVKEANQYVKSFRKVLKSLDEEHRNIISSTFLEPNRLDEVKEKYAIATFYRIREKSIRTFIERFCQ